MTVSRTLRRLLNNRDALIALAAAASIVTYVAAAAILYRVGFALDDAWIHQTYARNLAERGEWAFVAGQPSAAATSPLYAVLLAVGHALGLPIFVWTFGLGFVSLAAGGWFGARLADLMFPQTRHAGLWTGLALVLMWHLVWASASGMETGLFCTLTIALMWLGARQVRRFTQPARAADRALDGGLLGLVGAATMLARPEGAGLLALVALAAALGWPDRRAVGGLLAWAGGVAAGFLVGALPYALLNLDLTGSLLPDTASAKQAEYAPLLDLPLLERYARLVAPILAGGQILLLPGAAMALRALPGMARERRAGWIYLVPLAWSAAVLTAYALRLPANYQHGRYVIPALPPLVIYGVGGTLLLLRRGRRTLVRRVLTRSLAASAVVLTVAFWVVGARAYAADVRIIESEMVATARWVAENIPPEELTAAHDIGALGYFAPRPLVDLAGLVTPDVVPIIRDREALMGLMCARGVVYLVALPDQVPADMDDPRLGGAPVYVTGAPYAPAAGSGNMAVYRMRWPERCETGAAD